MQTTTHPDLEPVETCSDCEMLEIASISNTTACTVGRLIDALGRSGYEDIEKALKAKILEQIELI